MPLPIVAAGAVGSTAVILLAIALLIHLLSKEEVGIMTIAFVIVAYFWFTSR